MALPLTCLFSDPPNNNSVISIRIAMWSKFMYCCKMRGRHPVRTAAAPVAVVRRLRRCKLILVRLLIYNISVNKKHLNCIRLFIVEDVSVFKDVDIAWVLACNCGGSELIPRANMCSIVIARPKMFSSICDWCHSET